MSNYNGSSGYDYGYIEPSPYAGSRHLPASPRHTQWPDSPDSSAAPQYAVPRLRLRGQAPPPPPQQPYPSNNGSPHQPYVSGTQPQIPVPSRQQEMLHGLPSRQMGGNEPQRHVHYRREVPLDLPSRQMGGNEPQRPVHHRREVPLDLPSRQMGGNEHQRPVHSRREVPLDLPSRQMGGTVPQRPVPPRQEVPPGHPSRQMGGPLPQSTSHSRQRNVLLALPSRQMGGVLWSAEGTSQSPLLEHHGGRQSEDNVVEQMLRKIEGNADLMADNPLSEQRRTETLREMPNSLTLKRMVKRELDRSVNQTQKSAPLSTWKMFKYSLSMSFRKLSLSINNMLFTLDPWYDSLKTIEGHFGSGVASYFKFLRWLFILNTVVFLLSFGFVVIPQLLHSSSDPAEGSRLYEQNTTVSFPDHQDDHFHLVEENNSTTYLLTPVPVATAVWKVDTSRDSEDQVHGNSAATNVDFSFGDIFTGEGSFTNTILYHGYYTYESVSTVSGLTYHMPAAYFFTVLACYIFMFLVLSASMARSYRRTFIKTTGDVKDLFCHKVFCGWDFSISTSHAAELKLSSIYYDLQELLNDMKKEPDETWQYNLCLWTLRISLNVFVGLLIAGSGTLIWFLLHWEVGIDDPEAGEYETNMSVPIIITILMMMAPVVFSWLVRVERYVSPRTALFVTLTKTFVMEAIIIGIVVGFWITFRGASKCWETSVGQEVYRLVIMDFLFAIVGASLFEICHHLIYKRIWNKVGAPEFNIARNTLNIIYNQTLFLVGLYFSPLLAFIVVLKMFITFYIRKFGLLHSCRPSTRPWRAAQTRTMFLVLSFLANLLVLILLGYIITQVESSKCGPFQHYDNPSGVILDVFEVTEDSNGFKLFIRFITRPGVIAIILLAMAVGVYYLSARSRAYNNLVCHLRDMLHLEALDKQFLLNQMENLMGSDTYATPSHYSSPEPETQRFQRQRFQPGVREHRF